MLRCPVRIVAALLVLVSCVSVRAQAPSIQYVYDQLGRLIAVVDLHGDTVRYLYDEAGNLLSIQRHASSHISIISFSPDSGPVGTTVTISGTGFSLITGEDLVMFHGVAASVVGASVTQLVAVVPAGATSGQIDVSVPDGSAKSSAPFTVAADSGSPTITSFTPTMGGVGTAISLTGTGFDAAVLNNRVSLNASVMNVTSAATTTLATSVPGQTMGGRIQVATARGSTVRHLISLCCRLHSRPPM